MIMIQPKGTFLSTYIYPRTSDKQVNVNTDRIVIARRLIIRLQLLVCVVDPCYLAVLRPPFSRVTIPGLHSRLVQRRSLAYGAQSVKWHGPRQFFSTDPST